MCCESTLRGHSSVVNQVCDLHNGNNISVSVDCTLKVWDPASWECVATLEGHYNVVTSCCVLANGNVVTASYDQTLKFWDVEQMMCVRTINDHWYGQFIYCGIACGYVVAICTDDNNLLISDTHYTSLPGTLEGHTADVMSFCALG